MQRSLAGSQLIYKAFKYRKSLKKADCFQQKVTGF